MSMGIPPDNVGRGSLGGIGGRATRGGWSTDKRVGLGRAEHAGVMVVDQSID